jgi:hypothetical protein
MEPRFGTVDHLRADGSAVVRFDGDSEASTAIYPQLSDFIPDAGDRVLLLKTGMTHVIIGRVSNAPAKPVKVIPPKEITALFVPGTTYTANEQKILNTLINDITALRNTLTSFMAALRAVRKG